MESLLKLSLILIFSLFGFTIFCQSSETESDSSQVVEEYSKRGLKDIFEGEPGKAALYSLILPGAGQAYNRRWWKVPIALGIEGFFIYRIVNKRNAFKALDNQWRCFITYDGSPPMDECGVTPLTQSQIKDDRDDARQEMEYAWVFWGISHLIVTLEAFIDRHLINFDISDDLSIRYKKIKAPIMEPSPYVDAISLRYTF